MFMRCGVILIDRIFYITYNNNTDDICLHILPPSSTGTIARVRVSTYVGGAHAGPCCSACLRSGPLQEGGAVTRGPPNERGPRMSGPRRRTTKKRRANSCSGSARAWGETICAPSVRARALALCSSRRWLGSRHVLEPGAASVPGVCSGIELRVQVPPNQIDKGRTRREGPFFFWGICVGTCVSGALSFSSNC